MKKLMIIGFLIGMCSIVNAGWQDFEISNHGTAVMALGDDISAVDAYVDGVVALDPDAEVWALTRKGLVRRKNYMFAEAVTMFTAAAVINGYDDPSYIAITMIKTGSSYNDAIQLYVTHGAACNYNGIETCGKLFKKANALSQYGTMLDTRYAYLATNKAGSIVRVAVNRAAIALRDFPYGLFTKEECIAFLMNVDQAIADSDGDPSTDLSKDMAKLTGNILDRIMEQERR